MSLRPTRGHLRPESPRAADWQRVFGGLTVPLLAPFAIHVQVPDVVRECYRVDVAALTPEQRRRAVEHIVQRFGVPAAEVEADLDNDELGLPILAEDVSVTFDQRALLDAITGHDEDDEDDIDEDDEDLDELLHE